MASVCDKVEKNVAGLDKAARKGLGLGEKEIYHGYTNSALLWLLHLFWLAVEGEKWHIVPICSAAYLMISLHPTDSIRSVPEIYLSVLLGE